MLVVGAGPAGSAAATWAARSGLEVDAGRRGGVPAGQVLRRRADPPGDGRAGPAGARRVDPAAHGQRRAPGPRLRPGARAAVAGRLAARARLGGDPDRAGRPAAPDRARRRAPGRCRPPRRSTWSGTASAYAGWSSPATAAGGRSAATGWWSPTGCARRSAGCSAGSGTATPSTGSPPGRTSTPGREDRWISSHLELRGPGRRAAVGLRLDLPAGRRPGEPGRRHPGHGEAAGERLAAAAAGVLRRPAPGRSGSSAGRCACPPRPCCRWAARSAGWPGRTGR